jgi:REP element-mobilizing transposase RayT
MVRPLRIEFPGALYHVTSRGDHREAIYRDDMDRRAWLETIQLVCARFHFVVHAYCLMPNHYHLLLETEDANLSKGMRQLNGLYTQRYNRRHAIVGHLFQGRYKAIIVQKEIHLLELSRYVVLNPVRAGIVTRPEDWPWSSYLAMLGTSPVPKWLQTDWLLQQFGATRNNAMAEYIKFVAAGHDCSSPLSQTRHQLLLGDDAFVARYQQPNTRDPLIEVPLSQKRALVLTLEQYRANFPNQREAMARAYLSGAFTMRSVGEHFGVSPRTVSRAVLAYEAAQPQRGHKS